MQGCVAGGWQGGRLSDNGVLRVVSDDLVMAVMQRKTGGQHWRISGDGGCMWRWGPQRGHTLRARPQIGLWAEEGGQTGRRVAGGRKERVVGTKREGGGRSAWGVAVRAGSTY